MSSEKSPAIRVSLPDDLYARLRATVGECHTNFSEFGRTAVKFYLEYLEQETRELEKE